MSAPPYIISIRNDKVQISWQSKSGARRYRALTSPDDLSAFIGKQARKYKCTAYETIIMYSSSMDFPEDSTSNEATIKLAMLLTRPDALIDSERGKCRPAPKKRNSFGTQLHAGKSAKTGEALWHTRSVDGVKSLYWTGDTSTRTAEQLYAECLSTMAGLLRNHPELAC